MDNFYWEVWNRMINAAQYEDSEEAKTLKEVNRYINYLSECVNKNNNTLYGKGDNTEDNG